MAAKDNRETTPQHVAIIMDGNGRWALRRGKQRLQGHKAGSEAVRRVVEAAPDLGIRYLTLFAFSTENWRRSEFEVAGLMALFRRHLRQEATELMENGVRVRFIGRRDRLNAKLVAMMDDLTRKTANNDQLHLTVAIDYGARDELARAASQLLKDVSAGALPQGDLTHEDIAARLDTADLPDPDLVIRTSGETRISNFLLWQCAYSEYEFSTVLWPDFSREHLSEILLSFSGRERRFGAVPA